MSAAPESFAPIADDPALPRVLLIGDSISVGYTLPVRELLVRKANIHRPLENCEHTFKGLERIDGWLGAGPWQVIHFNFGLHDLKFVGDDGRNTTPHEGRQVAPLSVYEANLRRIVRRLKQTGATLIWCSTTPVPDGAEWRIHNAHLAYNQTAGRVMSDEGVIVNDLCAAATRVLSTIQLPHNVHFTDDGYRVLAKAVAAAIEAALQSPRHSQLRRP